MSFRDNLKSELTYQDIQIKELTKKTGISKNTIGNYLTGHNSLPTVDKAVEIAQALNVSVEYLVTGKQPELSQTERLPAKMQKIIDEISELDDVDFNSVLLLLSGMKKRYKQIT